MPVPDAVVDGSLTAIAQTVAVNTTGRATADIVLSGTWVGSIQFEFLPDGGTTWYALPCTPVVTPPTADVTSTTANGVWKANVAAFPQVRVRSSAWTSGTATVRIEASEAARSGGSLTTVTGTVAATIADGADVAQGTTTDANTAPTVVGRLTKIRDLLAAKLGVTIADGDNATQGAIADAIVAAGATGTVSAKLRRITQALEDLKTLIVATVTGNIASGSADSGNPVKVGGKYNLAAPTFTDGQRADLQSDAAGNLKVTQATLIAGEDAAVGVMKTEQRFTPTHITTNATTTVKSAAGMLHAITINTKGASSNVATVTLDGTAIGVIDTTANVGTLIYDATFNTSLVVTTATGTAADLTVMAR